mmetsp:Transcript_127245/g.245411  ORF Transcript_127245/g.245411 Transcript_127245/m.245411 type:complete len:922 (-) Transcript_127245:119-2884(-)
MVKIDTDAVVEEVQAENDGPKADPTSPMSLFSARSAGNLLSARTATGTLMDLGGMLSRSQTNAGLKGARSRTFNGDASLFSTRSLTARFGGDTERTRKEMMMEDKKAEREWHRERRGLGEKKLTSYELVDHGIETFVKHGIEQPMCLQSCLRNPTCQRVCFPAEYATRNHRKHAQESADGAASNNKAFSTEEEQRRFGLPEWGQAGYCLMPPQDTFWYDLRVPRMLGLQVAVHRKTSVERLCFCWRKNRLPATTTKDQMMGLVKSLKRCDHANILKCHEVAEDIDHLYFLYDNFPCITLLTVLEKHKWTQEQLVNLAREMISAVNYASTIGLPHMGWTLSHILLPHTCMDAHPDPRVGKVHGFGLMGVVYVDNEDRMCWAPEAIENYNKLGESFIVRMEPAQKFLCDFWSLGILIYSLVARRPPILGSADVITELILARKWAFTLAFDEVDREAKTLVEGLLESVAERRTKPEMALRNEWIRRRTIFDPREGVPIFLKAEEFANSPLPKRLFGRFLVRFLDSDHMRSIAFSFYLLDTNGDGVVCQKDLFAMAKHAGKPLSVANDICKWLIAPGQNGVSHSSFAEVLAEEVIDGRALRHAFESLDDDGSEQISPEELLDELIAFDSSLTMDEVIAHIEAAEGDQGGEEQAAAGGKQVQSDMQIDFDEFCALFPVRVQRIKNLEARLANTKSKASELGKHLDDSVERVQAWIDKLQNSTEELKEITQRGLDKDGSQGIKDMKKQIQKINEALKSPPGPHDVKAMIANGGSPVKKIKKGKKGKGAGISFGYDSFLQDQAMMKMWPQLIFDEIRMLKQAVIIDKQAGEQIDHFKAHDAAESVLNKIDNVLNWSRCQFEEYQAFVEVLRTLEEPMPDIVYSSRGLMLRGDAEDDNDDNDEDEEGEHHTNPLSKMLHNMKEMFAGKG